MKPTQSELHVNQLTNESWDQITFDINRGKYKPSLTKTWQRVQKKQRATSVKLGEDDNIFGSDDQLGDSQSNIRTAGEFLKVFVDETTESLAFFLQKKHELESRNPSWKGSRDSESVEKDREFLVNLFEDKTRELMRDTGTNDLDEKVAIEELQKILKDEKTMDDYTSSLLEAINEDEKYQSLSDRELEKRNQAVVDVIENHPVVQAVSQFRTEVDSSKSLQVWKKLSEIFSSIGMESLGKWCKERHKALMVSAVQQKVGGILEQNPDPQKTIATNGLRAPHKKDSGPVL